MIIPSCRLFLLLVFFITFLSLHALHHPKLTKYNHRAQSLSRLLPLHAKAKTTNLPDFSQSAFPEPPPQGYDLIVLGSGPGGEAAAINAAKLGALVAVIEKKSAFGGPTGLSSKAVREATRRICSAVDQIGGDRRRQIAGLWKRKFPLLKTAAEAWQAAESRERLRSSGCDLYIGSAELVPSSERGVTKTIVRVCRPTVEQHFLFSRASFMMILL